MQDHRDRKRASNVMTIRQAGLLGTELSTTGWPLLAYSQPRVSSARLLIACLYKHT